MESVNKFGIRRNIKENSFTINNDRSKNYIIFILFILLLAAFLMSFSLGRYGISLSEILKVLISKIFGLGTTCTAATETVIFKVRIPRILVAMLVGGALSMSGASYQGLFKNPMVSPDILGASAGAGFGAAMGILMNFGICGIQISSFLFGLGAVALTFIISTIIGKGNNAVLVLVLTGMVVSNLFSSFISITKYLADPYSKLPAITFWLMGGLTSISMKDVWVILIPIILGAVPLFLMRWKLNVLSFGDEEAKAMGIDTGRVRIIIIVCSTLLTAASVSVSGMIGWVGLIIPHFARMLVGPNYKVMLPASFLIGSTFLLLVDDVARSLLALEIPLGILTSIIGAPFFIYLLIKGKRGWI
ncbi:FecCD family ABC transporter permease [Acetivibrio cellulolyticus]|uniref:FecCD family ABC transporter permease n=1 Tax=Acetivibrio cellulolyticus TaxID=35830 RepID=UPI0001E300FC|nr:iron ABC transporter permease [Acetivibrio cellulolyticus]